MEKSVFKVGDKVFDFRFGWGVVYSVNGVRFPINVSFGVNHEDCYTWDGRACEDHLSQILSFTEYTFEGFSQERPEELPKKGQICWVRDSQFQSWMIAHFMERINDLYQVTPNWDKQESSYWKFITTKNPYKDV
jgi:hypothetical protein